MVRKSARALVFFVSLALGLGSLVPDGRASEGTDAAEMSLDTCDYAKALQQLEPMAKRGDAPSVLKLTNTAHVPRPAVLASTAVGFLTTIVNYFAPEKVFTFLLASSGAVALLVYLVIAVAQLRMRKQLQASGQPIEFRMWLYPWLTWAVILFIVAALSIMLIMPEHRHEVFATALLTIFTVCLGLLNARRKPRLGEDYAGKTARV